MEGIEEAKRRVRHCLETGETELDLSEVWIGDLNRLPGLKECLHLTCLNLNNTFIVNLEPLIGLNSLTELYLDNNRIRDLGPLSALKSLTILWLNNNKIFDIRPISNIKSLTYLSVTNNQIVDLKALSQLKFLAHLDIANNQIVDLKALSQLKFLAHLNITNNQIVNLGPLSGLGSLLELKLGIFNELQIGNIKFKSPNNYFTELEPINLEPLSRLYSLIKLDLIYYQVVNIEPLAGLKSLTELNLDYNQIANLEPLSELKSLTKLGLSNNQIVNLKPLSGLKSLTGLGLNNNQIVNLEPLSELKSLIGLGVSNNQIVNLEPLSGLKSLTGLGLSNNQIVNLEPLSGLISLTWVVLSNNQITDFKPLLKLGAYILNKRTISVDGNPNEILNNIVKQGYSALNAYYDEQNREGSILIDRLKVIVVGNSTVGKTSLIKYLGNKVFDERQVTTHGIYTPMDIPLEDEPVRINVWDFGGQDYYHATHRLFITRDSTFILVCAKELENKPEEELTREYILEDGEIKEKEVRVQHYPYRYWLQTLTHLTGAEKSKYKMPLLLVENKCGLYAEHDNTRMRLTEEDKKHTPFEITGNDFFHLDIQEAWRYFQSPMENVGSAVYSVEYQKFEKSLLSTLRKQVKESRYEIISYFPKVRDTLEKLAEWKQNQQVSDELSELLAENKIDRIERYERLPVWISLDDYQDIVKRARKVKEGEPPWDSLHIYLQNICGRIFYFGDKGSEALKSKVFIDPNWLHQTIYKVLNLEVLKNQGEFTLEEADKEIDGNIIDAATFIEAMKVFELVFEIPEQTPRRFIAPQYLPIDCPLPPEQLEKYKEEFHELRLILEFSQYLPPSLISRLISLKGHLIKDKKEPLWRNGLIYSEDKISTFVLCEPKERKIEIYLGKGADESKKQEILRRFMEFMEKHFSEDMHEMLISLPGTQGKVKWKHLYASKKSGRYAAKDYSSPEGGGMTDTGPFAFLVQDFERKPIRVFVCYSHEVSEAMEKFTTELEKQLKSFSSQEEGGIRISSFSDLELKAGDRWDTVLQDNISKTDVLLCLLSSGFFTSSYIKTKEYGRVFRELSEGHRNTLIVPVYFKACYISDIHEIKSIQFYNPPASKFGLPDSNNFSFMNLLEEKKSYVSNYVAGLIEQLKDNLKEIWETS